MPDPIEEIRERWKDWVGVLDGDNVHLCPPGTWGLLRLTIPMGRVVGTPFEAIGELLACVPQSVLAMGKEIDRLREEVAFRDALIADLKEGGGRVYLVERDCRDEGFPTLFATISLNEAIRYAQRIRFPTQIRDQDADAVVWKSHVEVRT